MELIDPTILGNIKDVLRRDCRINPESIVVMPFPSRPDRIRIEWHQDLFAIALRNWHRDGNDGKNHGEDVLMSLRQPTSPSMQVCVHYELVVRADQTPLVVLYMEVDIDKYFLGTKLGLLKHGCEVVENGVTRQMTNQEYIAAANADRWETAQT